MVDMLLGSCCAQGSVHGGSREIMLESWNGVLEYYSLELRTKRLSYTCTCTLYMYMYQSVNLVGSVDQTGSYRLAAQLTTNKNRPRMAAVDNTPAAPDPGNE